MLDRETFCNVSGPQSSAIDASDIVVCFVLCLLTT
jgi:hypothetical protein